MTHVLRPLVVTVLLIPLGACGASPTAAAAAVTTPAGSSLFSGALVQTLAGSPVGGATIALHNVASSTSTFTATAVTDAAGHFAFTAVPSGTVLITITAPGYVTRQTLALMAGDKTGVTLDVIADAPPFSLAFYRQFARNNFDTANVVAINPWTMAPSFYVRTVTDDTGETVADNVLAGVQRVIVNSVPELTAGHFSVAAYQTGAAARSNQTGWVRVVFIHDQSLIPHTPSVTEPINELLGASTVGGNADVITLWYDPTQDAQGLHNVENCESLTVGTVDHEIVHAMGFFHTSTTFYDFQSGPGCPGHGRPAEVLYHAAIMYSRQPGNMDEDTDASVPASLAANRVLAAFFTLPHAGGQ